MAFMEAKEKEKQYQKENAKEKPEKVARDAKQIEEDKFKIYILII